MAIINQLRSLPHQIFRNNPELIAIFFHSNQINSITPDFVKNLNKLQWVDFNENQCIDQYFECDFELCSELDRGLSTCYLHCLQDGECAAKSGQVSTENGNPTLLAKKGSTSEEVEKLKNESLECDAKKFEEITRKLKVQENTIETLRNNLTLLVQAHDSEVKSLKQKLADMKIKLQENKE